MVTVSRYLIPGIGHFLPWQDIVDRVIALLLQQESDILREVVDSRVKYSQTRKVINRNLI